MRRINDVDLGENLIFLRVADKSTLLAAILLRHSWETEHACA
jgi:hypothetical protein